MMKKFTRFLVYLLLLSLAGGGVFLAQWEIPPPAAEVEKVVPDDRFPR